MSSEEYVASLLLDELADARTSGIFDRVLGAALALQVEGLRNKGYSRGEISSYLRARAELDDSYQKAHRDKCSRAG